MDRRVRSPRRTDCLLITSLHCMRIRTAPYGWGRAADSAAGKTASSPDTRGKTGCRTIWFAQSPRTMLETSGWELRPASLDLPKENLLTSLHRKVFPKAPSYRCIPTARAGCGLELVKV